MHYGPLQDPCSQSEFVYKVHSFCIYRHAVDCLLWMLLNFQHIKFLYLKDFRWYFPQNVLCLWDTADWVLVWWGEFQFLHCFCQHFHSSYLLWKFVWSLNFGNLLYLQDLTKNLLLRLLIACRMFLKLCHQASEFFIQPLCFSRSKNYCIHVCEMIFK